MCTCTPCAAHDTITPHSGSDALALIVFQLATVDQEDALDVVSDVLNAAVAGLATLSETDVIGLANVALDIVNTLQPRPQDTRFIRQKVDFLAAFSNLVHKLVQSGGVHPTTVEYLIQTVGAFTGHFATTGADQSALAVPLVESIDGSLLNATHDLVHLGSSGVRTFVSTSVAISIQVAPLPLASPMLL
jgi:hypothetical protein